MVTIEHIEDAGYPKDSFNPSVNYPEYIFGNDEISNERNDAYELVRRCLKDSGLDKENYGKKEWNPLGDYIKPGDKVVIKPNFVMDHNENREVEENSYECLVTHTSCIRAIADYALKALGKGGSLLIGDAPMQGCDFSVLKKKSRLDELTQFYEKYGYNVRIKDFREYQAELSKSKVIKNKTYNETSGIVVEMGESSHHYNSPSNGKYQVSDYDMKETMSFHHQSVHTYVVNREILEADVVINFCKPKTHRLAGFTGAMKNMVGTIYNKACLPHRSAGSKDEAGDGYLNKSFLKRSADRFLTKKIRAEKKGHNVLAQFYRYMYGFFLVTARKFSKDKYFIGSWYGNDTIWRTICDLNRIVLYADKKGVLQNTQQRTMLNFGDMIVAGEHNGPVSPSPKKLGIVMAGEDAVEFDVTLCKLMGFSFDGIPLIRNLMATIEKLPEVKINGSEAENLAVIAFPEDWHFVPHDCWINK